MFLGKCYLTADDWADVEEESSEEEEAAGDMAKSKPKPAVERLQKKAHMNIIFIGHVGMFFSVFIMNGIV